MNHPSRRTFVKEAALAAGAIATGSRLAAASQSKPLSRQTHPQEWRNKVDGMSYRQLGNTGLMISEIVQGGSGPMNPDNYKTFEYAIERGLNYFDSGYRYGRGKSEEALGMLTSQPGMREKVFISTKLSEYTDYLDRYCTEIFKGLPGEKQEALRKKAKDLIAERGVMRPGYFFEYFPRHRAAINKGYLSLVIRREYVDQTKFHKLMKARLIESFEISLKRLRTDYVDILHCPHGGRLPEELEDPVIPEVFEQLKKQGKARFSGLSIHNDPPRLLNKAVELGYYDMAMCAYNIVNQGTMDLAVENAVKNGVGIIAMKAASSIYTPHKALQPIQDWRIQKLHHAIPEEMKLPVKGYLWALQNPNLTAVISEMWDHQMIDENLAIAGKKVDLQII